MKASQAAMTGQKSSRSSHNKIERRQKSSGSAQQKKREKFNKKAVVI